MNTLNNVINKNEIMDGNSIDEYLENAEAMINAKHPADKPRKITANFIARECCDEGIIKTWKKMLEWIADDAGGSIEIKVENNHNPHNIDLININYVGANLYNYSIHTREYKKDYTHKDMGYFVEIIEILTLAIYAGKTFEFINTFDEKQKEMDSYAELLLNSDLHMEFEPNPILLTEPLTYDQFIKEQVPSLVFLGSGQGWWVSTEINYKWDHHPDWVTHISADANDDDTLNVYIDVFEDDEIFKRLKKTSCDKKEAIGIFWDVLVREQLPKNIDEWEDITNKRRRKENETDE